MNSSLYVFVGVTALCLVVPEHDAVSFPVLADTSSWQAFVDFGLATDDAKSGTNSWRLTRNIRAGMGYTMNSVAGFLCFDYYRATLADYSGTIGYQTGSPVRYDLACYGEVKIFRILGIGIGGCYSKAGTVTFHIRGGPSMEERLVRPGIYLFYTAGIGYEIPLGSGMFIPISIYYRNERFFSYYQVIARAGFGMKL